VAPLHIAGEVLPQSPERLHVKIRLLGLGKPVLDEVTNLGEADRP
jgi:hypothetical protein